MESANKMTVIQVSVPEEYVDAVYKFVGQLYTNRKKKVDKNCEKKEKKVKREKVTVKDLTDEAHNLMKASRIATNAKLKEQLRKNAEIRLQKLSDLSSSSDEEIPTNVSEEISRSVHIEKQISTTKPLLEVEKLAQETKKVMEDEVDRPIHRKRLEVETKLAIAKLENVRRNEKWSAKFDNKVSDMVDAEYATVQAQQQLLKGKRFTQALTTATDAVKPQTTPNHSKSGGPSGFHTPTVRTQPQTPRPRTPDSVKIQREADKIQRDIKAEEEEARLRKYYADLKANTERREVHDRNRLQREEAERKRSATVDGKLMDFYDKFRWRR